MNEVAPTHNAVNASRNGRRWPPRSESAPRTGETMALSPTLTTMPTLSRKLPSRSPNCPVSVSHSPMAPDTTAKLKIVFAKSYIAQAAGTRA